MTITRIYCPSIATQWLQILPDYANLSDDSDFFRGIFQIAPEEIKISSGEKKNSSEISTETSEEWICPLPEKSTQLGRYY